MRYFAIMIAAAMTMALAPAAQADDLRYRRGDAPDVEIWTNKGEDARYYYGEDVAVYLRAEEDCYVVVYDIDPSGEVNVLFPSSLSGSSYVTAGRVYRIPDYNDDFRLEVSGKSGTEHIYAVVSRDYINPPDFMRYIGYDYGPDNYYDDDYFVLRARGNLSDFTRYLNDRIVAGSYDYVPYYGVYQTRFLVDTNYRHHRHYRYWDYDPYHVGSVWVGAAWPGGEVWIDGVYFGIAPILIPRVIVGYHWVWVYYGGYPCYQRYFYVPSYQRYTINVHIDGRFQDHHYRRDRFRTWVFEEKKYRNEDNFRERARESREKQIRTRTLPPSVIRDYADRGVLSKDAPIVKKSRIGASDRDIRDRSVRPGSDPKIQPGRNKVENPRVKPDISGKKATEREKANFERERAVTEREKANAERERNVREKKERGSDNDTRVIVPEKSKAPEQMKPAERERRSEAEREHRIESERKSAPEKKAPAVSEGSREKAQEKKEVKSRTREPENNSGSVERDKPSKTERGSSSSRNESGSSKKSGKAAEGKGRSR